LKVKKTMINSWMKKGMQFFIKNFISMFRKFMNWIKKYGLAILIVLLHWYLQNASFEKYIIFYLGGFALLYYAYNRYEEDMGQFFRTSNFVRRIYFIYVYFLLLFSYPFLKVLDIWADNNKGIFGFNEKFSTVFVFFLFSLIVYLLIVSDFNISEISFKNTKISLYQDIIKDNKGNTQLLLSKIDAEYEILQSMKDHCKRRLNSEIILTDEYQRLIEKYFSLQKESVKVTVMDEWNEVKIREDYPLKYEDIYELKYNMGHDQIYSYKTESKYYLFLPFKYLFESYANIEKVFIILESSEPLIYDAESKMISNILIKFTDDFLYLLNHGLE